VAHELTHAEASELLGAYALDALDAEERDAVDLHLSACTLCRTEVQEHVEVAGLLSTGIFAAPASVWNRISEDLRGTPPPLDLAPIHALRPAGAEAPAAAEASDHAADRRPDRRPGGAGAGAVPSLDERRARRRGSGLRIGALVAAASVAASVIGVLGLKVMEDGRRIDAITAAPHGEMLEGAVEAAMSDPEAVRVEMRSPDGRLYADAVMLPDGRAYLARDNLPPLSPDRNYQLWAVVGNDKVSVGVLGSDPQQSAFVASGPVAALAITDEMAGGVVASRQQALVLGGVTQS
jgi:hypothetical protein